MALNVAEFRPWLDRWALIVDGEPLQTRCARSRLLPVLAGGQPAIIKLGASDDERRGSQVMAWWNGRGAAPVLAHDADALLMARAVGERSLSQLARSDDAGTTRIICSVVEALHGGHPTPPPPGLPPLERLFAALRAIALTDPRFHAAHAVAASLLSTQRECVVLHGDIHHDNVLDFGPRGWLAIDPWGYVGERAYDYANLLKNPDPAIATAPGRLAAQLRLIADAARLDPVRLRDWAFAHAALSAAWSIEDGDDPALALAVMAIAAEERKQTQPG